MKKLSLKTLLVSMVLVALAGSSCKKVNSGPYGVNGITVNFTVPATTTVGDFTFTSQTIKFNTDSVLKSLNLSGISISKATVDAVQFTVLPPSSYTFQGIDSLSCYFSTPTIPAQLISSLSKVPDSTYQYLSMPVSSVVVTNFITNNTFVFTLKGKIPAPITQPVTVQAKFNYSLYVSN